MLRYVALVSVLTIALVACDSNRTNTAAPVGQSFEAWADAFTKEWARNSPQLASRTQYFSGEEQDKLDRELSLVGEWGNSYGRKAAQARAAVARRGLNELQQLRNETLTPSEQLS